MPVVTEGKHTVSCFAAIGEITESARVRHVGLAAQDCVLSMGDKITVLHQRPPPEEDGVMKCNRVGWLDGLSRDECQWLGLAAEELIRQAIPMDGIRSYYIHPAIHENTDPVTRRSRGKQFSCAGFVSYCYLEAGIELVVPESDLPEVSRDELREVYGTHVDHPTTRRLGLSGDGPWKVLLPDYIIEAFKLTREEHPYSPESGDGT